jgi:hypothetical protein
MLIIVYINRKMLIIEYNICLFFGVQYDIYYWKKKKEERENIICLVDIFKIVWFQFHVKKTKPISDITVLTLKLQWYIVVSHKL